MSRFQITSRVPVMKLALSRVLRPETLARTSPSTARIRGAGAAGSFVSPPFGPKGYRSTIWRDARGICSYVGRPSIHGNSHYEVQSGSHLCLCGPIRGRRNPAGLDPCSIQVHSNAIIPDYFTLEPLWYSPSHLSTSTLLGHARALPLLPCRVGFRPA